jgi:hypothetical protein
MKWNCRSHPNPATKGRVAAIEVPKFHPNSAPPSADGQWFGLGLGLGLGLGVVMDCPRTVRVSPAMLVAGVRAGVRAELLGSAVPVPTAPDVAVTVEPTWSRPG